MQLTVWLREGLAYDSRAVERAVGMPIGWLLPGPGFDVTVPPRWPVPQFVSYLQQQLGPAIVRIEPSFNQAPPLGGCNCLGRR